MKIHIHLSGLLDNDELRSVAKTVQIDPEHKREAAAAEIRKLMDENGIAMHRLSHSGWFEVAEENNDNQQVEVIESSASS